ncbi:hypothetical protein GCM10012284_37410 [Mangrovihabitans endophyticus]|uniref:LysM domain-containing protein n=2 Tax=Mangrovihabitans endophyticus TaxID=1751298 RepID=A0A8J3C2X2_9ACTN|nr:hypothetical protein GCM10012284_37410 [Mangrovihabitans endophyticus]
MVVASLVLVGGPPWLLWAVFGSPVTVWSSWWNTAPFTTTPEASSPAAGLKVLLIWAGWLAWAALVTLLAGSIAGVLRGRRLPPWRLPMPLHRLVVGLTGTATVALVTTPAATAAAASPAAHVAPSPDLAPNTATPSARPAAPAEAVDETNIGDPGTTASHHELITVSVGEQRYEHRVRRGDTLSKIAKTWLGDPDRWPEVCRLNKHRHFTDGRALTDCDLIYPGWQIRLPADAVAPPDARPAHPPRAPARPAPPAGQAEPSEPPAATSAPTTTSPDAGPGASARPAPPASTSPAAPDAGSQADDSGHGAGDDLVLPGGSLIPWTLALAITATAALVWMQRRRRYQPGTHDDLHDLPAPVLAAQHHTRHTPTPQAAEPPHLLPRLPSGGAGLVGPGADAAARGLLITALTTGTPSTPGQRAEVITDRHTLATLLGDTPLTGWNRLHLTDTLDQALTLLDTHLLRRARILDEHNLADLGTLRDTAPSEEALPPLLLITHTDQATGSNRARVTFGLTQGLDITTVILGHWPHGPTLSISDNGHARPEPGSPHPDIRLAVLDIDTTRDLLAATREAHTGQPPPADTTTPPPPAPADGETSARVSTMPLQASRASVTTTTTAPAPPVQKRARLRVLGTPRIENITAEGRPLRAKALELAVFLAVHPDGASTRDIGEYLEPDARLSQADQRVHTNASNLRHVLGRAGTTDTKNAYVIKTAGRYRLDPATVDVDVWNLRDLLRTATIATEPRRRELLTTACNLCTAPLADGRDYEWIQPHRETVRRWSTDAHLMLAEDLLDSDPQDASDLLDKAIGLDRYNEALYTHAMHARHRLADADGIRILLRALSKALADLDAEPREDTIELADNLRTSLTST